MRLSIPKRIDNVIVRIIVSYFIFILLVIIFNHNSSNRLGSFLTTMLSAVLALIYLGWNRSERYVFKITQLLIGVFLIKLIIGYLFWQFYIFPDYFSDPSSTFHFSHREYLLTEKLMREIALYRIQNGFFSFPSKMLQEKYIFIHYIMSNLYLSGCFSPLDLSVQNTLFSIYTGVIITQIVRLLGATPGQQRCALVLALFQPMSMVSTIIWRDVVGQTFIALGGLLLIMALKRNVIYTILMVAVASLLMFAQRYIYLLFPSITIALYYIFSKGNKWKPIFLVPVVFGLLWMNSFFDLSNKLSEGYGASISGAALWTYLPLNILRLFIGPFPWTNWFAFDDKSIFLIADYFQAVLNVTLLLMAIMAFISLKKRDNGIGEYSFLFILFMMFMITALGTIDIHLPYMATGIIFLIPIIIAGNYSCKRIYVTSFVILVFFIFLNVTFISLGLSGQGIGSSFR